MSPSKGLESSHGFLGGPQRCAAVAYQTVSGGTETTRGHSKAGLGPELSFQSDCRNWFSLWTREPRNIAPLYPFRLLLLALSRRSKCLVGYVFNLLRVGCRLGEGGAGRGCKGPALPEVGKKNETLQSLLHIQDSLLLVPLCWFYLPIGLL